MLSFIQEEVHPATDQSLFQSRQRIEPAFIFKGETGRGGIEDQERKKRSQSKKLRTADSRWRGAGSRRGVRTIAEAWRGAVERLWGICGRLGESHQNLAAHNVKTGETAVFLDRH